MLPCWIPVATPVATPTPTAVATPVAKAWPEFSELDEMLHDAFSSAG